ncbi:MAG: GIY-YIG nuclease family protein [Candidatus Omnitrophica bacterium]|nr:GIY-YIG nuclease family protein [Candidatus Omnitrophota bacterium]
MKKGYVYILKSIEKNRFYIGSTNNLEERLKRHKHGLVKATRPLLPVELKFFQEYGTFGIARKIELKLKKLKRKDYIENIIKDGLIKWGSSSVGPDAFE